MKYTSEPYYKDTDHSILLLAGRKTLETKFTQSQTRWGVRRQQRIVRMSYLFLPCLFHRSVFLGFLSLFRPPLLFLLLFLQLLFLALLELLNKTSVNCSNNKRAPHLSHHLQVVLLVKYSTTQAGNAAGTWRKIWIFMRLSNATKPLICNVLFH